MVIFCGYIYDVNVYQRVGFFRDVFVFSWNLMGLLMGVQVILDKSSSIFT